LRSITYQKIFFYAEVNSECPVKKLYIYMVLESIVFKTFL